MGMKGDFLSFSFAGLDSSELNIVRTSDGDRFDEQIVPEIKDVTVEVPGMDGEYFFGSTYGPRSIDISFAFDSLTEEQFRRLRKVYGRRRIGELILSERPYKRYMVKIESPIELSYICFDEPKKVVGASRDGLRVVNRTPITEEIDGEEQVVGYSIEREQVTPYEYQEGTERIYKGEGKVTFIAYFPFAKSNFKVLPELGNEYYEGRDDWAVSSGILSQEERDREQIDVYSAGAINVYNAGDVSTGFRLYIPSGLADTATLTYNAGASNQSETASLIIKPFNLVTGDEGVLIDTNSCLIVGVKDMSVDSNGNPTYTTTGNLYNGYIESGYFFKLQPNLKTDNAQIQITNLTSTPQIFYDYLYF